jgi:hypothetical protein
MGGHEVLQPPILFGVAEIELQLKAQAVIVNQFVSNQRQITAKQNDMRHCLRFQIGFDDDHTIE